MVATGQRPRIGVTGPQRGAWGPRTCVHLALKLAGARPIHLRPDSTLDPERLDGVVITGGHDIDPVLYKAAAQVGRRYDPERDAFESAVIDAALERATPLLAICRGAQLLNVRLGGDLVQDLKAHRKHTSSRRTIFPTKALLVEQDTQLQSVLNADQVRVNSLHHQAINCLGSGLRVSGRDRDDIVQAVEYPGKPFVLGVQWHPEFLLYLGSQRRLFKALVSSAAAESETGPT